ncbi:hypothetical protein DL769_009151 [Monosporascus sp. CRB-8-3]|nr:hypothetical protein DL769_009151 [Monosporascus sp. CRB-8-3]
MSPDIQILARGPTPARIDLSFMRIQYTEITAGQPLPEFRSGDWNVIDLVWDEVRGAPTMSNPRNAHIASAETCYLVSIDYFELKTLSQLPFTKLLGHRSDTLYGDASLIPGPMLIKIAEVPPVDLVENETVVYAAPERTAITPRFLPDVPKSTWIVGFLVKDIEGRAAGDRDFSACEEALERLHDEGWVHHDAHLGDFVVKPDGTVLLIDFEYAQSCQGQWRFEENMANVQIYEG